MPQQKNRRTPSLRLHKASGQAYVELDGRRRYLGVHGRPETIERYHLVVAEWLANAGAMRVVENPDLTVAEIMAAYYEYAQGYYVRKDGKPTTELAAIAAALRPLATLYATAPAKEFGPTALRTVQQQFVDLGLSRTTINGYIGRVKRMFRWAASRELVAVAVYQALATVDGIRRGRGRAREADPVVPVPQADIEAVRSRVSRQVGALIDLQLLTGARPGELLILRPCDVDTTGDVWVARPVDHKTAHHGKRRAICFGPRAQAVLRPFLLRDQATPCFSPVDADRERSKLLVASGQLPVRKRKRGRRAPGDRYSVSSYRRAITRACEAAGIPGWSPNRLRHNAATAVRAKYGLDAAQVILGHATANVTQLYAAVDEARAIEIAKEIG